jgi:hypothetical protein
MNIRNAWAGMVSVFASIGNLFKKWFGNKNNRNTFESGYVAPQKQSHPNKPPRCFRKRNKKEHRKRRKQARYNRIKN